MEMFIWMLYDNTSENVSTLYGFQVIWIDYMFNTASIVLTHSNRWTCQVWLRGASLHSETIPLLLTRAFPKPPTGPILHFFPATIDNSARHIASCESIPRNRVYLKLPKETTSCSTLTLVFFRGRKEGGGVEAAVIHPPNYAVCCIKKRKAKDPEGAKDLPLDLKAQVRHCPHKHLCYPFATSLFLFLYWLMNDGRHVH